jgi:hypothetical protein
MCSTCSIEEKVDERDTFSNGRQCGICLLPYPLIISDYGTTLGFPFCIFEAIPDANMPGEYSERVSGILFENFLEYARFNELLDLVKIPDFFAELTNVTKLYSCLSHEMFLSALSFRISAMIKDKTSEDLGLSDAQASELKRLAYQLGSEEYYIKDHCRLRFMEEFHEIWKNLVDESMPRLFSSVHEVVEYVQQHRFLSSEVVEFIREQLLRRVE